MIDFKHEINKIVGLVNKKIISEETARYEALKLKCLAEKLRMPLPDHILEYAVAVDSRTVNEDMQELTDVYRSGLLKKQHFIRDNMKILAVCEAFGLEFPGSTTLMEQMNVKYITEAIDDFDEGDFDDLPEDEDFEEGKIMRIVLDDCEVAMHTIGSLLMYEISGKDGTVTESNRYEIILCLLLNHEKARGPLGMLAAEIRDLLEPKPDDDDLIDVCLRLILEIIDGRATIDDLKERASEADGEFDWLNKRLDYWKVLQNIFDYAEIQTDDLVYEIFMSYGTREALEF
jgi:hypothetical protein